MLAHEIATLTSQKLITDAETAIAVENFILANCMSVIKKRLASGMSMNAALKWLWVLDHERFPEIYPLQSPDVRRMVAARLTD